METNAAAEEQEKKQEEQNEKKRGFLLTFYLVLMFVVNPLTAFTYFTNPELVLQASPELTVGILYFLGVISIVNVAIAAGVWAWKKWAVYGFFGIAAIALGINLYIGIGIMPSLIGLIGPVIIYFTAKSRWEHFS
ncbi:MAG: hypothetical protein ACI96N_003353 [Arenicella sp.]|jgi:hypothetical protein